MLVMSDSMRELVTAHAEGPALHKRAISEGMRGLRLSGAEKVKQGLTTPAEVLSVVQEE